MLNELVGGFNRNRKCLRQLLTFLAAAISNTLVACTASPRGAPRQPPPWIRLPHNEILINSITKENTLECTAKHQWQQALGFAALGMGLGHESTIAKSMEMVMEILRHRHLTITKNVATMIPIPIRIPSAISIPVPVPIQGFSMPNAFRRHRNLIVYCFLWQHFP